MLMLWVVLRSSQVLFAFVPPTDFGGGWVAFTVALIFIGVLTSFVSDIATIFGCTLGLPDAITAITFVALGTFGFGAAEPCSAVCLVAGVRSVHRRLSCMTCWEMCVWPLRACRNLVARYICQQGCSCE